MRPGQNKRMRGRTNRKGPNPLTRTYESSGPDVKIRGTAHHVAEKYLQLARDAQSSGDPVMAESYLQHAEHYFRLIAAAQLAQQQALTGLRPGEDSEEDDDDDDNLGIPDRFSSPIVTPPPVPERYPAAGGFAPQQQPNLGNQPQPYLERQPYNDRQPQPQGERQPRQDRGQDRGQDNRQERPYGDRNAQGRTPRRDNRGPRDFRQDQQPREFQPRDQQPRDSQPREQQPRDQQPRLEFSEQPTTALPAFITAPVRTPNLESADVPVQQSNVPPQEGAEAGGYHLRPRRRRRPVDAAGADAPASDVPVID